MRLSLKKDVKDAIDNPIERLAILHVASLTDDEYLQSALLDFVGPLSVRDIEYLRYYPNLNYAFITFVEAKWHAEREE